jgi:N-methylhydantoinase B
VYRSVAGEMTAIYGSDGDVNASKGVLGGHDGAPSANWKRQANGELVRLPGFGETTCRPDEKLEFRACSGGGYGDPTQRDPRRVVAAVNREWLSQQRAETIYQVVLKRAPNGVDFELDEVGTARRRAGAAAT